MTRNDCRDIVCAEHRAAGFRPEVGYGGKHILETRFRRSGMSSLHPEVADRIAAELEAGAPPWVKSWSRPPDRMTIIDEKENNALARLLWLQPRDRGANHV